MYDRDRLHDEEIPSLYWDTPKSNMPLGCFAVTITLIAGFLFFVLMMTRADTSEQAEALKEWETNALFCGVLAIASWAILFVRGILGNGKEQAETLKNAAQVIIPARPKIPSENKDILVRASSETPSDTTELLRPVQDASDSAPNELLRASDSE